MGWFRYRYGTPPPPPEPAGGLQAGGEEGGQREGEGEHADLLVGE